MKKLFTILLAASALLTLSASADDQHFHPQFAYLNLTESQEVCPFQAIDWCKAGSVNSDDIYIDSSDPHNIILKKRGYYLVTFTTTGVSNFLVQKAEPATPGIGNGTQQFSLFLNGCEQPIPGSTYAAAGFPLYPATKTSEVSSIPAEEIVGQVIFRVSERFSTIQLVNTCNSNVFLVNNLCCNHDNATKTKTTTGNQNGNSDITNVPASIVIQRLSSLDID